MNVEDQVVLDKFSLRHYQEKIFDAIESGAYKRVLYIAPRRCLSGDTHIIMSNGSFKLLKDIRRGDSILSWNGAEFVPDTVKHIWTTGLKKTCIIQSPTYLPITTSLEHRFAATFCGWDKLSWVEAGLLSKKRLLLQYSGTKCGTINNPDLAEFWGFMLADGYICHYQQPKFTNNNKSMLERVEYLAKQLFDVEVIWRPKGNGFDLGFSNGTKGGGTFPNPIKELFRSEGLDVPKSQRKLPEYIHDLDEDSLMRFFAGLISADGNIYCHKKGFTAKDSGESIPPANEISISCGQSDSYAWSIYWLLRKIGIVPQVPYKERQSNWKIKISKGLGVKKLLSSGPIYGKEEAQQRALFAVANTIKSNKVIDGCFRSTFTRENSPEEELYDIETAINHNFVANGYVVHNSGKDILGWNLALRQCIRKICLVFYVLPTYSQARKCIFDAITIDGTKFLDFIPPKLVESINQSEMKIRFVNGSILQCIGGDTYDTSIVGTNPYAVILSEYALMDPDIFSFIRPILAANGGWCLVQSTPRGKNALWHLYKIAQELPEWLVVKQTADEIQHIPEEVLLQERQQMDEGLFLQEYMTSFERGISGSYYGTYLDALRSKGQICPVAWEPGLLTYTAWDIGVRDQCGIIFFQMVGDGTVIRIIDCYANNNLGLDHYAKILQDKPYRYGKHFAPHDIRVREWGGGAVSRYEKARQLGIEFTILDQIGVMDGIENVWTHFNKFWIDSEKCKSLVDALENYRKEWDETRQIYQNKPVHNWASTYADCIRYLCMAIYKTKKGMSSEEFERQKAQALYGNSANLPRFFRDDPRYDRQR